MPTRLGRVLVLFGIVLLFAGSGAVAVWADGPAADVSGLCAEPAEDGSCPTAVSDTSPGATLDAQQTQLLVGDDATQADPSSTRTVGPALVTIGPLSQMAAPMAQSEDVQPSQPRGHPRLPPGPASRNP